MISFPSMEHFSDVIKEGLVSVKVKSALTCSKKNRWMILHRQSSVGGCRLSFFEDPGSSRISPPIHVVPLYQGDRAMIYTKKNKYGIMLSFRDGTNSLKFTMQSLYDAEVWMQMINDTVGSQFSTLNRPKTPLPVTPDIVGWSTLKKKLTAVYHVKVLPCPSLPWRISLQCRLEISSTELTLLTLDDPAELLTSWPIDSIVRYGQDQNCFVIETDSRTCSGETRVKFISYEAAEIYHRFQEAALNLIRLKTGQ